MIRLGAVGAQRERLGGAVLSPDRTKLAAWAESGVVVWDVNESEAILRVPASLADGERGPIAWSPDSQALVYLQVASFCPLAGKSTMAQASLADGSQTLLVESEAPTFGGVAWETPGQLRLTDEKGSEWRYDFARNELVPTQ